MKHVLLSFFLATAAFSATTTVDFTRALNLEGDITVGDGDFHREKWWQFHR